MRSPHSHSRRCRRTPPNRATRSASKIAANRSVSTWPSRPGTCVGNGTTTFAEFAEDLNPVDFGDDHWRFQASGSSIRRGESIKVVNTGGEFHTFTEVAAYGGGCVEDLNIPLGLTSVPECEPAIPRRPPQAFIDSGVGPLGGTIKVSGLTRGTHKFICLIHPWMRTNVVVR